MIPRFVYLFATALLLTVVPPAVGQTKDLDNKKTDKENENYAKFPYWRCEVSYGGDAASHRFIANVSAVSFVSIHDYVVDGLALVTEMNVGLSGDMKARFYSVEPLDEVSGSETVAQAMESAKSKLSRLQDRFDPGKQSLKVTKNYPVTTHTGTVEYRLRDRAQVRKVYKSLESSWRRRTTARIKVEL